MLILSKVNNCSVAILPQCSPQHVEQCSSCGPELEYAALESDMCSTQEQILTLSRSSCCSFHGSAWPLSKSKPLMVQREEAEIMCYLEDHLLPHLVTTATENTHIFPDTPLGSIASSGNESL